MGLILIHKLRDISIPNCHRDFKGDENQETLQSIEPNVHYEKFALGWFEIKKEGCDYLSYKEGDFAMNGHQ